MQKNENLDLENKFIWIMNCEDHDINLCLQFANI